MIVIGGCDDGCDIKGIEEAVDGGEMEGEFGTVGGGGFGGWWCCLGWGRRG